MYPLRTLALSTLLCGVLYTPLFTFAQTIQPAEDELTAQIEAGVLAAQQAIASSTQMQAAQKAAQDAQKAMEDAKKLQTDIDKFIEEKTKQILAPSEIQKKAVSDYLDVKINPKSPGPNESVRISIESYLTDLYKATMTWSLNGKVVEKGLGKMVFNFQNGPSGKTTRVSLAVTTNTGNTITKEFSFTPVGITILWEADTYTPPFYKGKALMVPQARVRVAAVPDTVNSGSPLGAGNLVYTWEKNDTVWADASGYGKNVFSFVGPIPLSKIDVRVAVSSLDDSTKSELRVNVPLSRPFILFYEKHPLLGVLYNKPFGTEYALGKKEFSISAEPYFFSNEDPRTPTLKYNWEINGKKVQKHSRTLTIRNDTGAKGDSSVLLTMRGIAKTFQNASQKLKVHTEGTETSDLPTF